MTTSAPNPKAAAWDVIGALYWNANYQGGPAGADIERLGAGLVPDDRIAVVGASTRGLIVELLDRGHTVTVLDFSPRMCEDLEPVVAGRPCAIHVADITQPVDEELVECFDTVLADRLLNRFTEDECRRALLQMLRLVRPGGELRTTVRLGLYARDLPLIEAGRRTGRLAEFFDEQAMVIDYGKAGDLLEPSIQPHGDIPTDVLLEFYRLRGPEKRFSSEDIHAAARAAAASLGEVVVTTEPMPVRREDTLFTLRRAG